MFPVSQPVPVEQQSKPVIRVATPLGRVAPLGAVAGPLRGAGAPEPGMPDDTTPKVITTEAERNAWDIVKAILRERGASERRALRDVQRYGRLLLDDNRNKRPCLLWFQHPHKKPRSLLEVDKTGPAWLQEGSAEYAAVRTHTHEGVLEQRDSSFAEAKAQRRTQARETAAPLQSLETYAGMFAVGGDISYPLGFMATDFLVENFGDFPALPALVSFYEAIGPDTTWQDAFQNTFGLSIDEFYAEFEAYRLEHFPPLP